jgi:hypothetical protein
LIEDPQEGSGMYCSPLNIRGIAEDTWVLGAGAEGTVVVDGGSGDAM